MTNRSLANERVLAFYNARGTAEQHIKEGKYAIKWTRLSCMKFNANAVRLQLHALAYNLANFLRTLATPEVIETWSLTSLRERLIKTGARLVRHGRYAIFQMAAAALPRKVFAGVLDLINGLRGPPGKAVPAWLDPASSFEQGHSGGRIGAPSVRRRWGRYRSNAAVSRRTPLEPTQKQRFAHRSGLIRTQTSA